MAGRVLISCIHLQRRFELYRQTIINAGYESELPQVVQQLDEEWLRDNIGRFDGAIVGDDPFPEAVLRAGRAGRLRALVKWGIGVDGIDQVECRNLGIRFTNTPGAFSDEVADVGVAYVLVLARGLHLIHESVTSGGWRKPVGRSLRGTTMGIIGLGGIGRALATRGAALGMNVIGYDVVDFGDPEIAALQRPFDAVLTNSDYLVLTCNLTDENRGMIDAGALARMKPDAYLVNVARGPLVVEADLVTALTEGHIAGAALDVFEVEPLPADSELRRFEQCVFGSHNGSNTAEAVDRVNALSVDLLLQMLEGSA